MKTIPLMVTIVVALGLFVGCAMPRHAREHVAKLEASGSPYDLSQAKMIRDSYNPWAAAPYSGPPPPNYSSQFAEIDRRLHQIEQNRRWDQIHSSFAESASQRKEDYRRLGITY